MTTSEKMTGSCLCGAIKFTATFASNGIGACHCGMCRKWSGGPWLGIDCGTSVSFTGEDKLSVYNSSDWAERGFCSECGSSLFYRVKKTGQHFMAAGLFDNTDELILDHQIFIDRKPAYFDFANETENLTEAEVLALYASKSE